MREYMKKISLIVICLVTFSMLVNIIPAEAAVKWKFSTSDGKKKAEVNATITLKKQEVYDMNLYRNGKEIKQNDAAYKVSWYSSNAKVVYIDKQSGKLRADKYNEMTTDSATAKITAVIKNKKTGNSVKKSFKVKVVSNTAKPTVTPITSPTATPKPTAKPTPTPEVVVDGQIRYAQFYVEEPVVGQKPADAFTIVQNDILELVVYNWTGTFDENGCFIANNEYTLVFEVKVREGFDITMASHSNNRNYYLNENKLGIGLVYKNNTTYRNSEKFTPTVHSNVADLTKLYTREQADALNPVEYAEQYGGDLIIDEALIKELRRGKVSPIDYVLSEENMKYSAASRILIDYPADSKLDSPSGAAIFDHANAKEIWLSPEMDLQVFLNAFLAVPENKGQEGIYVNSSEGATTWDFTLYVSDQVLPNGLLNLYEDLGIRPVVQLLKFRTLLYSGDVYEAFEKAGKGEKVGKEWCPGHVYTAEIMTSDRAYNNRTCSETTWFYYSCKYCGKCEYNDKHLFAKNEANQTVTNINGATTHRWTCIIDPSHYLGTNDEGDPVYALTCMDCGYDYKQIECFEGYYTKERFDYQYGSNTELNMSYEEYAALRKSEWEKYQLGWSLETKVGKVGTRSFAVEAEKAVTAKVSDGFHNEVGWAAQNDLADFELLGNDYTKNITRLQFCSIMVRMAERLAEIAITPAPSTTFTDTKNEYALKAYAAGILSDQKGSTFKPNAILTREQIATYTYHALMWVKDNSGIRFTPYESKLAEYSDADKLSSYAKVPMSFMTALGLMDGDNGALKPKSYCTIEQALSVAYRSLDADKIGWYQCIKAGQNPIYRVGGAMTQTTYSVGDRVWVFDIDRTINRESWRLVIDPYNGLVREIPTGDFRPIKELTDADLK